MTDLEYLKRYYKGNIEEAIKRLKDGEPVQYIVGNVNFYGYTFEVNKDVLIPRFETEELVEKTLKYINKYLDNNLDIVDLGTGSGCIAITLKKELKSSNIDAVDISNKALMVAKKNAKNNNVDINFIENDFLNGITKKYDVIISNPPYISKDEEIMDIVKNNEPELALYANNDGLKCYETILEQAKNNLKEKNIIAFEIGYMQGEKLTKLAQTHFPSSLILLEKDLQNKDRFLFILNNCE
ncbi:MAG: peptide chain release factor N(5)-glutamine methyltransferase [Bacilli bacterium]|nr:peptide chain release factor N(5)-glutamine methyltransferase [Bacilli bacterium]